ncbi:MAG: pyruvate dehydrogenase complex dihydrolipoamide acetyltransferase [Geminicoccaceae bacterium]
MPIKILMPALSPTMTEGNLATWLKKEGDSIAPGDVIAEIETDKATMEVEAVDEGRLGKIVVPAGTEGVAVNAVIGLLLEEGEEDSALEGAADGGNGEARAAPAEAPAAEAPKAAPAAEAPTAAGNGDAARGGDGDRVFASPLARRMAEKAGLDLASLAGTGPHGRIVKADIEAAMAKGGAKAAPAAEKPAAPAAAAAAPAPAPAAGAPDAPHTEIALSNMRKVIARRLTESKQQIPHFYLTVDCELDALLKLRKDLNERPGADYKLSVNDLIIKATAIAIRQKPAVNSIWGGDKVYQLTDVDVSVAVAIDGGLITPIIRKADQKGLATISAEMKDLATRAKAGKLKPEEFQGGGFSLSNLGMYGIKDFAAVINPPQACILAVGAGEQRPVVKNGALAIATVMSVTLSVDHRVVDGALGAEWLQAFKKLVEDPISLML